MPFRSEKQRRFMWAKHPEIARRWSKKYGSKPVKKKKREKKMAKKVARRYKGKKKSSKHPGFKAVQAKIAKKQGISKERAGAILASSSRRASASAKRKNPRLKRVKGKYRGKRK